MNITTRLLPLVAFTVSALALGCSAAVRSNPIDPIEVTDSGKSEQVDAGIDTGTTVAATCIDGPTVLPAKLACAPSGIDRGIALPATWSQASAFCGTYGGALLDTACGGYLAEIGAYPNSADGQQVLLYDAKSLGLVAVLIGKNDQFWSCDGPTGITIDTAGCFRADSFGFCAYGPSAASLTSCQDGGAPTDAGQSDGGDAH